MTNINVKKLMQDEAMFFNFLRSSPQHAVVLSVIGSAIDLYHRLLPRVVASHDFGMQQDIALIIRFMKSEAHDRVSIRSEHSMLDGVERLFGDSFVESLLEHQAAALAEYHARYAIESHSSPTMEHLFQKAGAIRLPTWGAEYGRANVSQLLGLRMAREEVFSTTREKLRAYYRGDRKESGRLKLLAEQAQKRIGLYAELGDASSVFKMVSKMKGIEAAKHVEDWVEKNTRIADFRGARDCIQRKTFEGRIYSLSSRNEDRLRA